MAIKPSELLHEDDAPGYIVDHLVSWITRNEIYSYTNIEQMDQPELCQIMTELVEMIGLWEEEE